MSVVKNIAFTRCTLPLGMIATLAGCGGVGSGGVASAPPPSIITNFSYTRTVDLPTTSHQLTAPFLRAGANFSSPQMFSMNQGLTITYDKATGSYALSSAIDGTGASFVASERITTTGVNREAYTHVSGLKRSTFWLERGPGILMTYTMFGGWYDLDDTTGTRTDRSFVTGSATKSADLPSGSATYALKTTGAAVDSASGIGYNLETQSTLTMTANFQSGQVNTSLTLVGGPISGTGSTVDFGTYSGGANITAATASYSGLLSGARGSGAFAGGFFGPQALETGYVWFVQGDTLKAAGNAFGQKN